MGMTKEQAAVFARLPLRGITREYPNHLMHLLNGPEDVQSPRELHPVFYGCFDWHSAVHGWWLLARCARTFPDLQEGVEVEELFERHFTAEAFARETAYFQAPGRASFERPYGWGWLLALARELSAWSHASAARWRNAMDPLVVKLRARLLDFLPRQVYPIRTGTHYNTAFALVLAHGFAQAAGDEALLAGIREAAMRYYQSDRDYPFRLEPGGDDFLSGGLCEALLMARVLDGEAFRAWFEAFMPHAERLSEWFPPARVEDRADAKLVHLDGVNLSRAWCLHDLAGRLPAVSQGLDSAARRHREQSLPHLVSGHFTGEHWLATFAALAQGGF